MLQVICTARVTTAQGFPAFRVDGASMTSNAADAICHGSRLCLRASRRYLAAGVTHQFRRLAISAPRARPGLVQPDQQRAEPFRALESAASRSVRSRRIVAVGGWSVSVTVAPPAREVRHQHPHRDAPKDVDRRQKRRALHGRARVPVDAVCRRKVSCSPTDVTGVIEPLRSAGRAVAAATGPMSQCVCQWPLGLPCGRSRDVPVGGHVISLLVAI